MFSDEKNEPKNGDFDHHSFCVDEFHSAGRKVSAN